MTLFCRLIRPLRADIAILGVKKEGLLRWKVPPCKQFDLNISFGFHRDQMGVSKNRGIPKWMVYNNGKPY